MATNTSDDVDEINQLVRKDEFGTTGGELDVDMIERVFSTLADEDEDIKHILSLKHQKYNEYEQKLKAKWLERQKLLQEVNDAIIDEMELLNTWLNNATVDSFIKIEDMLSDFDLATTFVNIGGLEQLKSLLLSQDLELELESQIYRVLGSCSKYQPIVQERLSNLNFINIIKSKLKEYFTGTETERESERNLNFINFISNMLRGSNLNIKLAGEDLILKDILNILLSINSDSLINLKIIKKISDLFYDIFYSTYDIDILKIIGIQNEQEVQNLCSEINNMFDRILDFKQTCRSEEDLRIIDNTLQSFFLLKNFCSRN